MSAHLERLIRIYNRLRRGPVTIEIISKWAKTSGIQVSERQLYRDLNKLKSLQIAEGENVIEYSDEKNRKIWKLEYKEKSEKLSHYDINSFFLLKNFASMAVLEERRSSIEKIEEVLYKSFSKNKYEQYIQGNELYLRKTNYKENLYGAVEHQQVEDLIWALHNQRVIVIEEDLINPANIHFDDLSLPLRLFPMELVFHRGRIHIAGITENNRLLIFAIDKALVFRMTNDRFNRKNYVDDYEEKMKSLFGISDPISNTIYDIKLEFTRSFAQSIKNFHWHHSQKWTELSNGNFMLELRSTLGRELVGFIAVGLDKIKVLEPQVLKELIIKKFKQSAQLNEEDLPVDEERANKDY